MSEAPFKTPTWPPDYSSYTSNEDQELINVLRTEANSRRAPESYRVFLTKLSRMVAELQLKTSNTSSLHKEYEKRIAKSMRECDTYAEYLATAKENYDLLFNILQEERMQRIDLEKKTSDLEAEIEKLKQEQSTRRSVPPPSTPPPPPTISAPPSPQQPSVSSPLLLQPSTVPSQQHLPSNLHEECRRTIRQLTEKSRELERQMKRLANGRQNLEEQLLDQFNKSSQSEAKAAQAEQARIALDLQNAQLLEQLQRYAQLFQQINGQPPPMGTFQPSQQRHQRPSGSSNAAPRYIHMPVPVPNDGNIPASMHDSQRQRIVFDPSQQHQQ